MKLLLSFFLLLSVSVQAQNGIIRSYYANHKIRARLSYVNDVLDAKNIWYYNNGNLKTIKTYDLGKLNGDVTEFYQSGLTKEKYSVANGIRDGIDKIYWKNGALKEVRYYKMGKLVKRVTIENDPLFIPEISDYKGIISNRRKVVEKDIPLCDVDICPTPIGGIKAIQGRVIYPKEAKQYGLEGTVSIVATIDKKGFVTAAEVIKGIGLGCDTAALKAVKQSRFLPGHNKGKIVKSHITINIEFKLEKKSSAFEEKSKDIKTITKQINIDKMLPETKIEDSTDIFITQTKAIKVTKSKEVPGNKNFNNDLSISNENEGQEIQSDKTMVKQKKDNFRELDNNKGKQTISKTKLKNIICNIDVCPEPVGGFAVLLKRFNIPRIAYRLKLNGKIVINAQIDKWGNVINTKVISGVGHGVGTAAEVAVLFTKFKPGMENGEPVETSVKIMLPVITTSKK